ncbi:MAG: hypothetical protein R3D59_05620 [Paracoccaceae bacterium]
MSASSAIIGAMPAALPCQHDHRLRGPEDRDHRDFLARSDAVEPEQHACPWTVLDSAAGRNARASRGSALSTSRSASVVRKTLTECGQWPKTYSAQKLNSPSSSTVRKPIFSERKSSSARR